MRNGNTHSMSGMRVLLISGLLVWGFAQPAAAEIDAQAVRRSIQRAIAYLRSEQSKVNGGWSERTSFPGGVTALCTLALLNAGVSKDDPAVQAALNNLRSLGKPDKTYVVALQTLVFCAAEPEKSRLLINRNVRWLETAQISGARNKGAWAYSISQGGGDKSNSQFALLALHEAERIGVKVSEQTWRLARAYWLNEQQEDGSWSYFPGSGSTGSMVCAGVTALVISSGRISAGDARIVNGRVQCCGEQEDNDAIERALQWLGKRFTVSSNPGANIGKDWLYYLYGVERVGRLTGRRFIGGGDWYRQGAELLVARQDTLSGYWKGVGRESPPAIATSFALLFLAKGRRPVLWAKLKHGNNNDWNRHRSSVHHLTRHVEKLWKNELTWQVVDGQAATVEELLQTPVLFLSGREALRFTPQEEDNLKTYLEQGGFLFAEACCNGEAFDASFRELMQRIFPDSALRLLPPDHPVWFAEGKVDPNYLRPLYGIDACCRTSVVYCPEDLSCYWELADRQTLEQSPPAVAQEIKACLTIGANVLAYATNRQLREKLDTPAFVISDGDEKTLDRATIEIVKLSHGGGADDAPNAVSNLLAKAEQELGLSVNRRRRLLAPTDEALLDYPLAYVHGRRSFRFQPEERRALARYLERGGFLFGDAICASQPFAAAFRREMAAIFPDAEWISLPPDHEIFSADFGGFQIKRASVRSPQKKDGGVQGKISSIAPRLEGLLLEGRLAVVFSPLDLSCALEKHASLDCKGYLQADAERLGLNILLYALQQ